MRRVRATAAIALLGGVLLPLTACSSTSEFCRTIQGQFQSVPADIDPQDAAGPVSEDLYTRYATVAEVAPESSQAAWQRIADFWQAYGQAGDDSTKLSALQQEYSDIGTAVAQVRTDVASCGVTTASAS